MRRQVEPPPSGVEFSPPHVRSFTVEVPRGGHVSNLAHGWAQLLHAASGVARVRSEDRQWVLPTGHALWIPPGCDHTIDCVTHVAFRTVYFSPARAPAMEPVCTVLRMSGLLRELVSTVADRSPLVCDDSPGGRLVAVLHDELTQAVRAPLDLAVPSDPRARRFADRFLAATAQGRSLDEIAHDAGASRRTMERLFRRQTGTSLGTWCRLARLHAAAMSLVVGRPVPEVAVEAGYSSASAFGHAFRGVFGTTPGRWQAQTSPLKRPLDSSSRLT